jgi:hypothetical protein
MFSADFYALSHNTTVKGSKGVVSTSDSSYTSIPSDSRKPPAAIDPSSESSIPACSLGADWSSLKELLHLLRFSMTRIGQESDIRGKTNA